MRRALWLWIAVLAVGAGTSWRLAQRRPRTPSDAPVERVILFAPNLNESAYVLGYGERLLALTDYCVWPPELLQLPRIGGMIDPRLERIAALAPDLLIVQGQAAQLRVFAQEQGVRLAEVKMDDELASIFAGLVRIDELLGGDGARGAALVAQIRDELAAIAAQAAPQRPRALISLGHEPQSLESLTVVGSHSFLGELLEIAGAEHIYADSAQSYLFLSLETLVADAPELVLEVRPGATIDAAERAQVSALWQATLPRVRVAIVDFDGAMIPGPRVAQTARAFALAVRGAAR